MSRCIAPLGWHIQLNATADQFVQHRVEIMALESPIVFDHMAQLPQPQGIRHPTFAMMKELVQDGRAWVKLSGVYQTSKVGPPTYSDSSEVAKALINIAPKRLVWGTNWPHPSVPLDRKPDDAVLLDLLAIWAPDAITRNDILVQNPQRLYGFPPVDVA
jgi:D-galactarolactone isomerase